MADQMRCEICLRGMVVPLDEPCPPYGICWSCAKEQADE